LYGAIILQAQAMSLSHAIDVLETQGLHNLTRYLAKLETASSKSGKSLSRDPKILEARQLAFSMEEREHPKQKRLRELVEGEMKDCTFQMLTTSYSTRPFRPKSV